MKTTEKIDKRTKTANPRLKEKLGYYFHPDEDFKEDWDWGKQRMIASKAISKSRNKFEI